MEIKKELLDAFFQWLKEDGLPPKKSERLWRKTLTRKLLNADPMTLENFHDFLEDREKKNPLEHQGNIPDIDIYLLIGLAIRFENSTHTKTITHAIEADGYIHLFFSDQTNKLVSKNNCLKLLEPQ